jgi:hypothetical protein
VAEDRLLELTQRRAGLQPQQIVSDRRRVRETLEVNVALRRLHRP